MKKKVNINRESISSEEIASQKRFGSLIKSYPAVTNPYRRTSWRTKSIVWVAMASVVLVYYVIKGESSEGFIRPPFEEVNIATTDYSVDASKGGDFTYKSGTKIVVAENSFLDKNGNVVKGNVDLKYREFRDPIDFFLSGIPMQYDSAGTKFEFESAGMIEIKAFKEGNALTMNPNSPVKVQLITTGDASDFNLYYLDTVAGNWAYKGKADTKRQMNAAKYLASVDSLKDTGSVMVAAKEEFADVQVKQEEEKLNKIREEIAKLEKRTPFLPRQLDETKNHFKIKADTNLFPELAIYKNIYFEVSDENENFTPDIYKTAWEDPVISEYRKGESYKLTFRKGKAVHAFIVFPTLKGSDYDNAAEEFSGKLKKHSQALAAKKEDEIKASHDFETAYNARREPAKMQLNQSAGGTTQILVTLSAFGNWNCAFPINLPTGASLALKLEDIDGKQLGEGDFYMVDKNRNSLFHYQTNTLSRFEFDPKSQNVFWAVVDKKMYVFTPHDFANVNKTAGEYTFQLRKIDKEIARKEDLSEVLGI